MLHQEWPLLIFTLLAQGAAGLWLAVVIVRELTARSEAGAAGAVKQTSVPSLLTGALMVIAVIISLLHLGTPTGAYRSLFHLGSSWLSREILASMLFGGLWLLSFLLERKGTGSLWLGRLTALAGVVLVFVMSKLYMASIIPAWTTAFTVVTFAATALVLGGVLVMAVKPVQAAAPVGAVLAVAGSALQLIGLPIYLAGLGQGVAAARQSLALVMGEWQPALWGHLALVVATAAAVVVLWQRKKVSPALLYSVLVVGIVSEALARVLFYAMGLPIQVG
ncbi:MAG TPA: DmsC/YnfH family molybdoenzyme membrane anchor subunit [Symbiobacteriaceae bacterium]|jgi:anaerobic dimethyl sulfoxide reductase subunit C (anchor subunit)|nr:DmsC/YnfH family molybdoenzyme membrane anchor subunit [Symbiobacteriaceae bacterium]